MDVNSGNPLGLASTPATSHLGRRVTAAMAYLSDVPTNLEIVTDAQVTKVIFEKKKAVGVIANGKEYRAKKCVVLSAGAVDTPKILMLSGVGPKEELEKHDIECIHELRGVGQNLQDHFFTMCSWRETDALTEWPEFYSDPDKVTKAREQFLRDGTGPLSRYFHGICAGFFKADEVLSTPVFETLPAHVQQHLRKPTVPMFELAGKVLRTYFRAVIR